MTRKNRDRLSIIAAILTACTNPGACKTRIMTQANLNFGLLEKYLDKVIKLHLVKTQDKYYTLTTLGQDFLRQYDRYYKRYVSAQELLAILDHEYQQLDTLISAS